MIIDHTALEVADLDARIRALKHAGLRVLREGTRHSTGQRIVMMGDGTGSKLELIEAVPDGGEGDRAPVFAHLALRTDDTDDAHRRLQAAGFESRSEPHDLAAARARSALLDSGDGFCVQVISYAYDSPDAVTWEPAAHNPDTATWEPAARNLDTATPAPAAHNPDTATPAPAAHNPDTATPAPAEGG